MADKKKPKPSKPIQKPTPQSGGTTKPKPGGGGG